jgi:Abnormal spindle-like microcephaly-assoc'd, ASPM-SPD-2-Hydin
MRSNIFKAALIKSGLAASVLLLAGSASYAQVQQINLTAGPTTVTMPDGSVVPMWGYTCGAAVTTNAAPVATCAALNPNAPAATTATPAGWSPVVITVPTGQDLQINLTNNLSFTAGTGINTVPTSLVIYGQLGGGLGSVTASCNPTSTSTVGETCTPSPAHTQQGVTWSTVGSPGAGSPTFTPPPQGPRVQSWGTEVAAGATTSLCWGVCAGVNPSGTPALQPGTYLIESGTHPSIQGPMGLYGILVVTSAPTSSAGVETAPGTAYGTAGTATAVSYDGEVPLLLGEIDPVQNALVAKAVTLPGFSETTVWSGQPGGCGNPATTNSGNCYPPAVNYTPIYYTINGVAFNKTNASASLFPVSPATLTPAAGTTGSILVRLVNAGLRMHVPSIVGSQTTAITGPGATPTTPMTATVSGFALIAEDGNRLPGVPRVQSEVFMAAGKTYDVMINGPAACTVMPPASSCAPTALAVYDRELSLSGNQIDRDAGMLAYIGANGATLPAVPSLAAAVARPDTYNAVVPGQTFKVSDPSKGVIANDTNVYGVQISNGTATTIGGAAATTLTTSKGTLTLMANGTFSYAAATGFSGTDIINYCANGTTLGATGAVCTTVTFGASTLTNSGPVVQNSSWHANTSTYLAIKPPGILSGATDANNLPLKVVTTPNGTSGLSVVLDANGGFTATATTSGTHSFTFHAVDSQGRSSNVATVSVTFPTPSNLSVTVLDGYDKATQITDYRWVIEEDRTFYVDPKCAQNPPPATCPTASIPGQGVTGIVPTLGVNFHTSYMPYVAQGCTGPLSCENGQIVVNPATGAHDYAVCNVGNGVCQDAGTFAGAQKTAVLPSQVQLDPTKRYYISVLPGDAATPFATAYTGIPCGQPGANPPPGSPLLQSGQTPCQIGHGMGGAPIAAACVPVAPATTCTGTVTWAPVTVLTQPTPNPTANLSVFVFEDDFPLNGEQDGGGGVDVLSPQEPGLGNFQIHLWDAMGGNGDFTGQMTYDMFNQPLTNSLDGTVDPLTGLNACPITQIGQANPGTNATKGPLGPDGTAATTGGITGMIVTCPKYEGDGRTLSPLAGQAVITNLMPGRWGVIATPGADRIARGEEWLQTNTLDGQKAHDSFTRIGEPNYFQEFGPAGFHVSIGFANPAIINARRPFLCNGTDAASPKPGVAYNCTNTLKGKVTSQRLSRTPDERLYESGSHDAYAWTQCYVSFGDADGEDFAFTKCDADGNFTLTGLPDGDWRVTTFDQWNDQLVDGLSTPVRLGSATNATCPGSQSSSTTCDLGNVAATQWQTNLYTKTFIDDNGDGIAQLTETGIPFANVAVRLRDGSLENLLTTDFTGVANFNETFPLFSWYTVETDVTRYKNTGTHVVYDVGGPADGSQVRQTNGTLAPCSSTSTGYPQCGTSVIAKNLANTQEQISLPAELRVPGAVYCLDADCTGKSIQNGAASSVAGPTCTASAAGGVTCTGNISSGRIDPPWAGVEGWQGFPGQSSFLEFGKAPYAPGENGGIHGHVVYASTRPFDDPTMLVQTQWTPLVPHVTMNLYQEGVAADGVTPTLTLVDTTQTSSWDDWAQGWRVDVSGNKITDANGGFIPNMNCPGQGGSAGPLADLFFFSLYDQPQYLDFYNNAQHGPAGSNLSSFTQLPYNSQFKCYDGMHNWNQLQPAPYDGMYKFPSVVAKADGTVGAPGALPTGSYVLEYDPTTYKTNCTICVPNHAVPTTDPSYGTPMLPPGKYVVEVVLPPGYELVKEEDKNILIGDNFIAPVTQQFGGLGNIFITPDQASVASYYTPPGIGYNANSGQNGNGLNLTQSFGAAPNNGIVPSFVPEPTWPCVGEARIVPDYISLFPATHQVAPFAGATRNLCDRKEVTLTDQMGAIAKFFVYTSTHIASKFTGGITDDYTSEFDPFSPQFGEKFAPPDLPVAIRDWTGNEISRVYADHWGAYNGMTYSTWEVNPPNPTGYAPTMMVVCMNDPGPIPGPGGTVMADPLFTQGYSQFCYELPFMPGTTQYLDTPVVPTSAFAGAGYNNVDCSYPDATPAIKEVDGDGVGPWVAAAGSTLTIHALGDVMVPNYAYSGPSANTAPYNLKQVNRHYGFGARGSAVLIDPAGGSHSLQNISWSDSTITGTVPTWACNTSTTNPNCPIQQQAQYGGPNGTTVPVAMTAQLVITSGNGKKSIDTVTVTIGGKAPTHVPASGSVQAAIDAAAPGDLIIIDPTCNPTAVGATGPVACPSSGGATTLAGVTTTNAAHYELLLMWKPVRLQGVGAASSIINASTHPAGKLDPWRRSVDCLFGLAIDGQPATQPNPTAAGGVNVYDSTGAYGCPYTNNSTASTTGPNGNTWNYFAGSAAVVATNGTITTYGSPQVDRLPLEAVVGWDASQNGNLAEQLQEPSLMGALEGAGITVLAKGLSFPAGQDPFGGGAANAGAFPTGTALLTGASLTAAGTLTTGDANPICHTDTTVDTNLYPSNFVCNPSSIDGLTVTQSSQGGGAIFVHGWGHYLQVANNRIVSNTGTLSGGINLGQGEFPPSYLVGGGALNAAPGSCLTTTTGLATNVQLPYCHNVQVNVHNNDVSLNSSTGDELFSATPAGAGGVSICTGADYYKFNNNWVCGNLSSGDGGGFGHVGFSYHGDIEHNSFIFNQSTNPTIPANGGGLLIAGAPDADPTCGATTDLDCVPAPGSIGPSDGVGPGLVINANMIMGNSAESGTGGGIAFQNVNGGEVINFPQTPSLWYSPRVTNNIIVDNVAGWDGAGISLLDTLNINIINNTIASNSTTASAGPLFNTIGAPLASQQQNGGPQTTSATTSAPQAAGLVALQNSAVLSANLAPLEAATGGVTCPSNHYQGATQSNGTCVQFSYPLLLNNVFWDNSTYYIGVGALSAQFQQNVISLYESFTSTLAPSQSNTDASTLNPTGGATITGGTGACVTGGATYWDIGVRGDTGPGNHSSTVTLNPLHSVITSTAGYDTSNVSTNPGFISQYCDGSRQPPEACSASGGCGWAVPAGISDATVPNPIFNLTPVATVDEGNNWVNMRWGPLSMTNPTYSVSNVGDTNWGNGPPLGNYGLASSSSGAYGEGATTFTGVAIPGNDFYGNGRGGSRNDAGAVQLTGGTTTVAIASVAPTSLAFGSTGVGATSASQTLTLSNTGNAAVTNITLTFSPAAAFGRATAAQGGAGSCTGTLGAGATCTINVVSHPTAVGPASGTLTITSNVDVGGSPVTLTATGVPAPTLASISPASGGRGTTVNSVTLTGTNLTGSTAVNVSGTGVTCTIVAPAPTGTTVNASCTITSTAALGARTVSVTTPSGTTNTVTFTVVGPSLTSIAPTSGTRGTTVNPVTLTGTDLTGATAVNVGGGGVTASAPAVNAAGTQATSSFAITAGAALGLRNVTVSTPNSGSGVTNAVMFRVTGATVGFGGPAPALTTGTPNTTTKTGTITVSNTATGANAGPLTLTAAPSIAKNGTAGGTFTIVAPASGTPCATGVVLNPGSNCTIGVQYAPGTSTATATATVTVTDQGAATASQSTTFSGN